MVLSNIKCSATRDQSQLWRRWNTRLFIMAFVVICILLVILCVFYSFLMFVWSGPWVWNQKFDWLIKWKNYTDGHYLRINELHLKAFLNLLWIKQTAQCLHCNLYKSLFAAGIAAKLSMPTEGKTNHSFLRIVLKPSKAEQLHAATCPWQECLHTSVIWEEGVATRGSLYRWKMILRMQIKGCEYTDHFSA